MMNNWTISRRLFVLSTVLLALNAVLGAICLYRLQGIELSAGTVVQRSLPGTRFAGQIYAGIHELRASIWRHLGGANAADKMQVDEQINRTRATAEEMIAAYGKILDNDEERQLLGRVREALGVYMRAWDVARPLSLQGETGEPLKKSLASGIAAYKELLGTLVAMSDRNQKRGEEEGRRTSAAIASARFWTWSILVAALLAGTVLASVIGRNTSRIVQRAVDDLMAISDQVSTASREVATASTTLAQGTTSQAAALETTAASATGIADTAHKNAESARSAAELMDRARHTADSVSQSAEELLASMTRVNESSGKVSAIIRVIDEIAFQTNILALNAAVEAARAGESGLGFAVVADEVRNLAHRSAQAAKDTAQLIEQAVADSGAGSRKVEEVVLATKQNREATSETAVLVNQIVTASREETEGITRISEAMGNIERATQQAAASAEESAAASEELTAQAAAMRTAVADLRRLTKA